MDLKFNVTNQIVTRVGSEKVVNMSEGYLKLVFDFLTSDWGDVNEYYISFKGKDGDYRFELDAETTGSNVEYSGSVVVPSFVTMGKKFIFGLYGVDDNGTIRITTNLALVRLLDSKFTDGGIAIIQTLDHLEADKVNYTDIVDNVTTNDAEKPLSAKQGKILKDLVDTKADSSEMETALNGKSDVGHNHDDRYYTETEMDSALNGKSDTSHTHDDRYYTETETNTLLNGKVSKETGKGLSTNDFTNKYKGVLDTFDGDFTELIEEHLDDVIDELTNETFYTKAEVDALLVAKDTQIILEGDKPVIQTGETLTLKAYVKRNGVPVYNERVEFYIENDDEEDEE